MSINLSLYITIHTLRVYYLYYFCLYMYRYVYRLDVSHAPSPPEASGSALLSRLFEGEQNFTSSTKRVQNIATRARACLPETLLLAVMCMFGPPPVLCECAGSPHQ